MKTSKQRLRVEYAPMVPSCSLSPSDSLTQVYVSDDAAFNPDRTMTPLYIAPIVTIVASDGTVGTKDASGNVVPVNGNGRVGDMKWLVNGRDITTLADWSGLYEIDNTTADTRGTIAIKRNIPQGVQVELRFEGKIADSRMGGNVKVVSGPVILTTTDSADDQYMLSLDSGDSVSYDPTRDALALYDYEVGEGLAREDASLRAQATDAGAYLRDIPVSLYRGMTQVDAAKVTLKVFRRKNGVDSELTVGSGELVSAGSGVVRLDLRLVQTGDYRVDAYTVKSVGPQQIPTLRAQAQFSVVRPYRALQVELLNTTTINPVDKERRMSAKVTHRGQMIKHPDRLVRLQWMSDTSVLTGVEHNIGERGFINLDRTGFNAAASDGSMDVYVDYDPKDAHKIAADSAGNTFTDQNGNRYILTEI